MSTRENQIADKIKATREKGERPKETGDFQPEKGQPVPHEAGRAPEPQKTALNNPKHEDEGLSGYHGDSPLA